MRSRLALVVLSFATACGGPEKVTTIVEPPPRDLGPLEVGPVAPEQRHLDAESYTIDVEGPPTAPVKGKVVATVTLKTKGDLAIQNLKDWRIEPKGPRDVDFSAPIIAPLKPPLDKNTVQVQVSVVPLRGGVKHLAFRLGGTVCNSDFCDVVADQVSFNLDVK